MKGTKVNKFLNVLAWLFFVIALVSYIASDITTNEPIYLVLCGIFCAGAPRKIDS